MRRVKIVVIGAGSASFGLANLGAILRTSELEGSELCLVDLNEGGLKSVCLLAERINKEWNGGFAVTCGTDRTKLLEGADFVLLSIALDREKCWRIDHEIARRHGIMHYAENGGPGALMHASRNIAIIMPILRDIERLCPEALVLNFTNPVLRICTAAARFSRVNMIGICHQIQFGYFIVANVLAQDLGIDVPADVRFRWNDPGSAPFIERLNEAGKEKLDILAAGINHFTWMLSIRDKKTGDDLYPLFRKRYREGYEHFEPLTRELFHAFDLCPVSGDCHLAEYLPYTHDMAAGSWEKYDIQMYPLDRAADDRNAMWKNIGGMAKGDAPIDRLKNAHSERAETVMASMVTNSHAYEQAVNLPNRGNIGNLPEGAIIEVPAVVSASGVRGLAVGSLPEPAAELCRRQITIAEMAVKAAVTGDYGLALQALAIDPMVNDPQTARNLLNDYLAAEKAYVPQFFSKPPWL